MQTHFTIIVTLAIILIISAIDQANIFSVKTAEIKILTSNHHNRDLLDGGLVVGDGANSTSNCGTLLELVLVERYIYKG